MSQLINFRGKLLEIWGKEILSEEDKSKDVDLDNFFN